MAAGSRANFRECGLKGYAAIEYLTSIISMTVTHIDQIPERIVSWVRRRAAGCVEIDLDYDLIQNRIIDSLDFVAFVILVEQSIGRRLSRDEIALKSFRTLRTVHDTFLANL